MAKIQVTDDEKYLKDTDTLGFAKQQEVVSLLRQEVYELKKEREKTKEHDRLWKNMSFDDFVNDVARHVHSRLLEEGGRGLRLALREALLDASQTPLDSRPRGK